MPDENEMEQMLERVIEDKDIPFCCGDGFCDIPELIEDGADGDQERNACF